MEAFDGSWHPGNGYCVQVFKKKGREKEPSWHAVTTRAKKYTKGECIDLAGMLRISGKTVRVLDEEGNEA